MSIEIQTVDYANAEQGAQLIGLLEDYALDPMGGGEPLADHTRENLVAELARVPGAFSLIAYSDGGPAGFANCFQGFSTFACRPLINIHDLAVSKAYRGQGISLKILQAVAEQARKRQCVKVTLEVLSGNEPAKAAYQREGFVPYELGADTGRAEFWQLYL